MRQICTFSLYFMVFFYKEVNLPCEVYWDLEMKHGFIFVLDQITIKLLCLRKNHHQQPHSFEKESYASNPYK